MAVSQIEEKILGRLAKETGPENALLSASFYQVLGLSIMLSRKLVKARRLRKLDTSRDTKSLQLYHHIIWLAREGLSITEVYILPYCSKGERGPECRVMAAKLRASFYHIFCLFHNHPPISQLSTRSGDSASSPSSTIASKPNNGQTRRSPKSPTSEGKRRKGKTVLRDPIPSMTSETSYVTNPYAGLVQTPPPAGSLPPIPAEGRRTPARPPGLAPTNISPSQQAASFLLPPINFVPLARDHFDTAQHLANNLLPPANALRLSVALEHAAFLWDCDKDHSRSRHLAKRTIQRVYASSEGLDDDEFADASALVQALGGVLNRGRNEPSRQPSREQIASPNQRISRAPPVPPVPHIDRTIAISPPSSRRQTQSPRQIRSITRTPERLSTVPEVESTSTSGEGLEGLGQTTAQTSMSPPISRLSSRSRQQGTPSDKGSKRRAAEQAEDQSRSRSRRHSPSVSGEGGRGSQSRSRQPTPQEGYVANATPKLRSSRERYERNSNGSLNR